MFKLLRSSSSVLRAASISDRWSNAVLQNLTKRCIHIQHPTQVVPKDEELPKYEISRDPKEWEYVERLLPTPVIPELPTSGEFPSGWVPPQYDPNAPYRLVRTKNGMLPIYLKRRHLHCPQRLTVIRNVHGDMQLCAQDIRNYLESFNPRCVHILVQEICGKIVIRGDFVMDMKAWALKKKF